MASGDALNALNQLRLISLKNKRDAQITMPKREEGKPEESSSRFLWVENKDKRFGERPDVNLKTILRGFKKHFINDFNEVTKFKMIKRRVKKQTVQSVVKTYVAQRFEDVHLPNLESYLLALILQKDPA